MHCVYVSYLFIAGNVGSDYFHFLSASHEDIPPFVYSFIMLIGIDMLSLIISCVFLKCALNIDLLKVRFPSIDC